MSDTPPTGAEWVEAIVKALHLGYLDALDDVQDRLKDMGQVWCNAHGSHVSRNDVHLIIDKLTKAQASVIIDALLKSDQPMTVTRTRAKDPDDPWADVPPPPEPSR